MTDVEENLRWHVEEGRNRIERLTEEEQVVLLRATQIREQREKVETEIELCIATADALKTQREAQDAE